LREWKRALFYGEKLLKPRGEKPGVELCNILIRIGALKFGLFTLTSGKLSPYYIDLRIVPSFPDVFKRIIGFYEEVARKAIGLKSFTRVSGIPTAGIPFASVLAFNLGKPFLYARKEAKTHGREKRVEGLLHPGDKVLIVDDLITTGKSTIQAIEAVRAEGGVVKDALVLIDRQELGEQNLKKVGVKLHSYMKISKVAKILMDIGTIDENQYREILKQVA